MTEIETTAPQPGLKTSTSFFSDLITEIDSGEIKVPQFQRPFVWKVDQALRLLDSIKNNYPIGSLLLWKTKDKLQTERNIGDFQLPETDDMSPTSYVLDGQQRLTVIYSALAEGTDGGFRAGYDLRDEVFVALGADALPHVFPLAMTFNTTALLNFRTQLQALDDSDLLQQRIDKLVDRLTRYQVPVVELRHLTLEEVCPIFERINSSGTKLSTYDLMVAATWSEEFDLNKKVEAISAAIEAKNFQDVSGDSVLKVLSAIHAESTRRDSILALRKLEAAEMDELVEKATAAMLRAVDLLATEFGVHHLDFLPYEAQLVILSYACSFASALTDVQVRRVRIWFWRTGLSEHYRGASDTVVSSDLKSIKNYVIDGAEADLDDFGHVPTVNELGRMKFRKNSAGSRAFSLALAKAGPRNLTNGALIDTAAALSVYNKKQFHHIFPQAYLRDLDPEVERSWLMNICMLAASENNVVSNSSPNVYLPTCIEAHGPNAEVVFNTNLLPSPLTIDYAAVTYGEFLVARATVVRNWLEVIASGNG